MNAERQVEGATAGNQPLAGIRVVDLTRVMTGPYCTMMLGDLGAEIIKVEQPGRGDDTRAWGPPFIDGESAYFLSINRNKRSLALNLKHPEAKQVLWRLIDQADVLVENFSPGTIDRLGFGYEEVAARRPAIIYASISGFGQRGPSRNRTAYDLILQGMGGLMSLTGAPGSPPTKLGIPIADIAAGMFAAFAIAGALFARERNGGQGQYIDTSMLGGQIALLTYQAGIWFATGQVPRQLGNAHPIVAPYDTYQSSDGYVNIAVGNDGLWQRFCTAFGLDDLRADPRLATNAGRITHLAELNALIGPVLESFTTEEIVNRLDGCGVPAGPIYDVAQVLSDPQVTDQELVRTVDHSRLGKIPLTGYPYRFQGTPLAPPSPPPLLGQHTAEILRDLGYDETAIATMASDAAIQLSSRDEE